MHPANVFPLPQTRLIRRNILCPCLDQCHPLHLSCLSIQHPTVAHHPHQCRLPTQFSLLHLAVACTGGTRPRDPPQLVQAPSYEEASCIALNDDGCAALPRSICFSKPGSVATGADALQMSVMRMHGGAAACNHGMRAHQPLSMHCGACANAQAVRNMLSACPSEHCCSLCCPAVLAGA